MPETSAVGFKYLANGKSSLQKLFWILTLVLSFVAVSFHSYSLISWYLSYPTVEFVKNQKTKPPFPSVTICDNDPVSQVNSRRHLNNSSLNVKPPGSLSGHYRLMFSSIPRTTSRNIGHRLSDMVLQCSYKGATWTDGKCSWKLFQNRNVFNCYTFIPHTHFTDDSDDYVDALVLIMYKEKSSTFKNPLNKNSDLSKDMKFTVHQVGEMPDVSWNAVSVQMGAKMSVMLHSKYT